ncbi:PTI1-like tyrosine-protein kinase 1 isoform X1 [Primulina eburnea]|uniref:PTI1-like tyrosine-protein kinase 1 isoform X1 n=1 Tax=Primulina eburnea TaxID=1245227 RepID=UPI003C6BE50C
MANNTNQKDHLERIARQSRHEIQTSSVLIIAIPVIITILILAIIVLVTLLRRLRLSSGNNDTNSCDRVIDDSNKCEFIAHSTINISSSPEENGGCLHGISKVGQLGKARGVQVITLKEAEMATDKFSEANLIRSGGAYKGVLGDGTVVAVEIYGRQGRQWERSFRSQVDLLSQLCSPYIAQLLGYCADHHHRLLIFEHASNGSLQDHLHPRHKVQFKTLSWGIRLRIALHCARALEYLHEKAVPSVIHRNFRCSNILLDHNFRAKLTGFELAKAGSNKLHVPMKTRVTEATGYLAPEYASTGKLTAKSDVYSYGVVLLELLTGREPIDTTRPPGEHTLVSWASCLRFICFEVFNLWVTTNLTLVKLIWDQALPRLTNRDEVVEMIDPALRNMCPKKDLLQVAAIAAMCVQSEADYRPLMMDVVQSLIPLLKNQSHVLSSFNSNSM